MKKTKRKFYGWKHTAFFQQFDHFFKDKDSCRPICGSPAIFTTAQPRKEPRGWVCKRCKEKVKKLDK